MVGRPQVVPPRDQLRRSGWQLGPLCDPRGWALIAIDNSDLWAFSHLCSRRMIFCYVSCVLRAHFLYSNMCPVKHLFSNTCGNRLI
jgi:hypothetical protein